MKQRNNANGAARRLLVISDHSGFSRNLIARWQMQPQVPEFTAVSGDLLRSIGGSPFDASVAGDLQAARNPEVLGHLNRSLFPAIYVAAPGESVHVLRRDYPRVTVIPRHDAWLDTLVLVADEVLKRADVSAHITRLEQAARLQQAYATLGKHMVEARHGFNNALTSVLGNAELLLLRSGSLDEVMQDQLETVHAMTLRLHAMMQRFTSLELEMQCVERDDVQETLPALSFIAGV
jgi:signal transduction histidine kinase